MKPALTSITALVYFLIRCAPAQPEVSIRVRPDRCQFFQYEHVSLSCEDEMESAEGWTVTRRADHRAKSGTCTVWGYTKGEDTCTILTPVIWDSGRYWCESTSGEHSRAVSLTFSDGDVILQCPVHPVPGGSDVTPRCLSKVKTRGQPTSMPFHFYRNGTLFSHGDDIRRVSKLDQAFYKCSISGLGESPESWMEVTNSSSDPSADPAEPLMTLTQLIIKILVFTPYVISTFLYFSIQKDRARARAAAAAAANGRRRRRVNDVIMEVAV